MCNFANAEMFDSVGKSNKTSVDFYNIFTSA